MSVQLVQTGVRFPDGTTQVTAASAGGVTSVNGQTGAVYLTAPVTSVNGLTGAVNIPAGIGWKVTYYNYALAEGSFYAVPANCIGFYCWVSVYGGGNRGAMVLCMLRNAANQDIFDFRIGGTNEQWGNDGGSGMWDSHSAFIPLESSIRYVYFHSIGTTTAWNGYIQSFVCSQ